VRRQQTLRASVDWSHALLTEPERVVFRRLAVFLGGFDLDAAQAVAGGGDVERYQVLDLLSLLVDKSLVVAESSSGRTRYRMLETVRQYAQEKLGESGEADAVRSRHRDHYTAMAALLDTPGRADYEQLTEQVETEIDNLRAAFGWSRENSDVELALALASSLQPLWLARGRVQEGRAWFNIVLNEDNTRHFHLPDAVRARALADKAVVDTWVNASASIDQAEQALTIAREIDDPALVARALAACGLVVGQSYDAEAARPYFAEAIDLARALGDRWRLSQALTWQANVGIVVGEPITTRAVAEEARDLADAIGDRFHSRVCRQFLGWARLMQGDLAGAVAQFRAVVDDADAAHDAIQKTSSLAGLSMALAYHAEVNAARAAGEAALEAAGELGEYFRAVGESALAITALASGDVAGTRDASEAAWQHFSAQPRLAAAQGAFIRAEAALADGDLLSARRWADDVSVATGWYLVAGLMARARVAIVER
jgi:hypothetical protein